jgi:hypothetical protein
MVGGDYSQEEKAHTFGVHDTTVVDYYLFVSLFKAHGLVYYFGHQ